MKWNEQDTWDALTKPYVDPAHEKWLKDNDLAMAHQRAMAKAFAYSSNKSLWQRILDKILW